MKLILDRNYKNLHPSNGSTFWGIKYIREDSCTLFHNNIEKSSNFMW